MVVKSLSRRSHTGQLLQYIFNEQKTTDGLHPTLTIRHNVRNKTVEGMTREFETNETYRLRKRKNSIQVYHVILSFSNKDTEHITDKILHDLTKKFIALRDPYSMYAGTIHRDRTHAHVHLTMSGVRYITGESNRISRAQFQEIKQELQQYQREHYYLPHSLPEHGKSKQRGHAITPYKNERTGGDKVAVAKLLHDCYSKAKSLTDFIESLSKQNHPVYYRNGKLTGLKFENKRKFRFRRLGYDELTLANLDHAKNMEKQNLNELQLLRTRSKDRDSRER